MMTVWAALAIEAAAAFGLAAVAASIVMKRFGRKGEQSTGDIVR